MNKIPEVEYPKPFTDEQYAVWQKSANKRLRVITKHIQEQDCKAVVYKD